MTGRQLRKARRAAERLEHKSAPNQTEFVSQNPPAQPGPNITERNRANAAHSTGPRTFTGKSRSSQNAIKHGLYSKLPILEWEDRSEFDELRDALFAEHQPATPTEEILVNELTQHIWRMRRFRYLETVSLGERYLDVARVNAVQRSLAAAERGFHKTLAVLRQLQNERGFVSQKPPQPAPDAAPEPVSAAQTGFVSQKAPKQGLDNEFASQNPVAEVASQPGETAQICSKAA